MMKKINFLKAAKQWHDINAQAFETIKALFEQEGTPVEMAHNTVICAISHVRFIADVVGKVEEFDAAMPQMGTVEPALAASALKKYIVEVFNFIYKFEEDIIQELEKDSENSKNTL